MVKNGRAVGDWADCAVGIKQPWATKCRVRRRQHCRLGKNAGLSKIRLMIVNLSDHLSIDDWLTSLAETDEELRELNIPRIHFLQNRWPTDQLLELERDEEFSNRRVILAMYVGQRAYILFSDWTEYQVIAAIEPKDKPSLYRAVVGKLLENRSFVPTRPTHIRNRRPDLVPDFTVPYEHRDKETPTADWAPVGTRPHHIWRSFLSDVLVGWFGKWLNLPEMGFWHEEMPESISSTYGGILMKYELSNGGEQRARPTQKKEEQLQTGEMPARSGKIKAIEKPPQRPNKKQKQAS